MKLIQHAAQLASSFIQPHSGLTEVPTLFAAAAAAAPGASSLSFPVMRELLEELGAPAPAKPHVALAFVAPAGLKEVQAALGSEVHGLQLACDVAA
jgi:hypothetical protein